MAVSLLVCVGDETATRMRAHVTELIGRLKVGAYDDPAADFGPVVTRVAELQESWMRSHQLTGAESGWLVLLDGVSDVQIQFFRDNGWSNSV